MMKVIWTNQFAQLPEFGGATRHFEFARLLKRYGIEVQIIAGNESYLSGKKFFASEGCHDTEGVRFCTINTHYSPGYVKRAISWFEFGYKLKKYEDDFKEADVVIGSLPTIFGAYATLKLAKKYKKPFILEVRDLWPEVLYYMGKLSRNSPIYRLMEAIVKKTLDQADGLITLSQGQRDYLLSYYKVSLPSVVIYNGVSDEIIKKLPENIEKFSKFSLVYAGALGYANNIPDLLREIVKLADLDIEFHLLGDGPYRQMVEDYAKLFPELIHYHGILPKHKAFEIMGRCHVGILSLKPIKLFEFGISPNKLFDYLSLGLFVISTVGGEMGNIALNSGCGKIGAFEELSSVIEALYYRFNKSPENFVCNKAREYVFKHFSRSLMAERLKSFLESFR